MEAPAGEEALLWRVEGRRGEHRHRHATPHPGSGPFLQSALTASR